jgi:hypothetical protein
MGNCGRKAAGTQSIGWVSLRLGKAADEIAAEHDLTLPDVYAALAYYFDHREEIDARITEDRAFAEALRARTPSLRDQKLRSLGGEA